MSRDAARGSRIMVVSQGNSALIIRTCPKHEECEEVDAIEADLSRVRSLKASVRVTQCRERGYRVPVSIELA